MEQKAAMKKLLITALTGLSAMFLLTGCEEQTDTTLKSSTNATITKKISKAAKPELVDTHVPHIIDFKGKKIKLMATYGIDKRYAHKWRFTGTESVNLAIKPVEDYPNIELGINNVYADVSISSKYARYDSVRQDSVNISYSDLPKGMVAMSKQDGYTLPFQVESINANQTSFYMINGFGNSSTHRISENELRENAYGAKLDVVWMLAITDKNGNTYFKTINDAVGIPYKQEKKMSKLDRFMNGPIIDALIGSLAFLPVGLIYRWDNDWQFYGFWIGTILLAAIFRRISKS